MCAGHYRLPHGHRLFVEPGRRLSIIETLIGGFSLLPCVSPPSLSALWLDMNGETDGRIATFPDFHTFSGKVCSKQGSGKGDIRFGRGPMFSNRILKTLHRSFDRGVRILRNLGINTETDTKTRGGYAMRPRSPGLWVLLIGILFVHLAAEKAWAFPGFSRKYNVPCSVCHEAFPKLNDFGQTFRDNGYQTMSPADLPENHPEGYWPIAWRTTAGFMDSTLTSQPNLSGALQTAHTSGFGFTGLDMLSFGTLTRDISYAVVYTPGLGSAGFNTGGSSSDLESVWARFDNLFDSSLVNLKIGKFELDLPFSEHRSLTLNTAYVVYHYTTGSPYTAGLGNVSNLSAAADHSDFALGDNQEGFELMGHTNDGVGTFRYAVAGLGNNNLHSDPFGFGGDRLEFYGHITQSYGGWGASSGQRVGLFGFYGQAPTKNFLGAAGGSGGNYDFYRAGADASLHWARVNLMLLYMHGWENHNLACLQNKGTGDCAPVASWQNASWDGGFAEISYLATPRLMLVYRYDLVNNQHQIDGTLPGNFNNVGSHTATVRYLVFASTRTEVWWHGEFNESETKSISRDPGSGLLKNIDSRTLLTAVDWAF